ncbi:MAG: acyl-CoA reductase-like NAD-dependent aldehyde dehydrogenase [Francisellaceae bacterium]|jgi:acyl-CoA reductase-like NAD-dependent aldehyde dehydrogenase
MKIINPSTGRVIKEINADTAEIANKKLVLLKQGQKQWYTDISIEQRIECVEQFILLLQQNIKELALDLTMEVGKPIQESENEINAACERCQYFVDHAVKILAEKQVNVDGHTEEILAYEPLGVVANISAWNYPYLVGVNVIIPALIAGNGVAYKPSEFAILIGLNIEKHIHESGVPYDVFQCFIGAKEVGDMLLRAPLDGYFFTGSVATGKHIAKKVAEKLVPLGLELGGKDPAYVTDDIISVKETAKSLVEGVFYNNGQSCCSVERIYVHHSIYDKFVSHFVNATAKLSVGDPKERCITNGAITRPQHLNFLKIQVKDALRKGAVILFGGHKIESQGYFFKPTVFINVDHSMRIMTEETFGPVIGIQSVKDDQEAISLMNDTQYGLTAGVFTADKERATGIIKQLDAGNVYWNCCDRISPFLPWAGRKNSGLGATLSQHGLYAFVKTKGVHLKSM